ncbi:MAG: hypothetical protein R3D98_00500 [Candidatus Krumholzibacteriia bacterium]
MRFLILTMSLLSAAAVGRGAIIQRIHYAPPQLPSAQGWTYFVPEVVPERDAFQIRNDLLVMDTRGLGGNIFCGYTHPLAEVATATRVTASMRCRMLAIEPMENSFGLSLGASYRIDGGQARIATILLGLDFLRIAGTAITVPVDATAWHDYTVDLDLTALTAEVSIDGLPVAESPLGVLSVGSGLTFGDTITPNNAWVEIAWVAGDLGDGGGVAAAAATWSAVKALFTD